MLEALFLDRLELYDCLEGAALHDFLETIQHVKRAKDRHILLLKLGAFSLIGYADVSNSSRSDSDLTEIHLSAIYAEHLSDGCSGDF